MKLLARKCGIAWTNCSDAGLMDLVDAQTLLREEISQASFTAGFKLAWGIAKELEADGLYPLEQKETELSCLHMEMRKEG